MLLQRVVLSLGAGLLLKVLLVAPLQPEFQGNVVILHSLNMEINLFSYTMINGVLFVGLSYALFVRVFNKQRSR
jgi:hypothetical protein